MSNPPILLWLRQDLRFDNHPAMRIAAETGKPVICIYIFDNTLKDEQAMGGAQRWWLHHTLTAFQKDLKKREGALILRRGDPRIIIPSLAKETDADHVVWSRRYMPWQIDIDSEIKASLKEQDIQVSSINSSLLFEPWQIETKSGGPYRVFTPYWKTVQSRDDIPQSCSRVDKLKAPDTLPDTDVIEDWDLLPNSPDWSEGFGPLWNPGEKGARARLREWLDEDAAEYDDLRNRPDLNRTSRLSPHLYFGEISPVTIWHMVQQHISDGDIPEDQGKSYLSEIVWREFSYHLIYHNPLMFNDPLQDKFSKFEWNTDKNALKAWQKGQTGYPIVDAGMRQLWTEGWMHNRVRMIVGSFLVKDLLLDWQEGMAWFWDTLLDADGASNTASWQWIAGCGADAAPFFRVFNPTTQGEKFDPEGNYVRKYVPELKDLPKKYIHAPADAPAEILEKAGVKIGKTYPSPIVNHKERREEVLSRYEKIK